MQNTIGYDFKLVVNVLGYTTMVSILFWQLENILQTTKLKLLPLLPFLVH